VSSNTGVGVLVATLATGLLVLVLHPFRTDLGLVNIGFLFLLLTLGIASFWGRTVGLIEALIANLAFNFFFIEPLYQFTVEEPRNVLALSVFLVVSVVSGTLISMARDAALEARTRQAETEVALALSRAMSGHIEPRRALESLCSEVVTAFDAPGASVLTPGGSWTVLAWAGHLAAERPPSNEEGQLLAESLTRKGPIGFGQTGLGRRTRIVPPKGKAAPPQRERDVAFIPLIVGGEVQGVLRLDGPIGASPFRHEPLRLLAAVASEAAVAVQRAELAKAAAHAEALREADELKTALMSSISHDLKTPLAAIKAAITSILDQNIKWTTEDIIAFHETIDSQADRLNRVISDILDLNRIEAGTLTPDQTPVRVLDLLQSVRDITAFETRGRTVTVEAEPCLCVLADESLIRQALVNLIENAVKYSAQGGGIHLTARAVGNQALITIDDEGPGIAAADLPFVFDRFYRAEEYSRRVKGSGLGLTIVKGFVELSGGKVWVESTPQGTRFSISLPLETPVSAHP
jgi:two-component system sensor histidine kinase KdpD